QITKWPNPVLRRLNERSAAPAARARRERVRTRIERCWTLGEIAAARSIGAARRERSAAAASWNATGGARELRLTALTGLASALSRERRSWCLHRRGINERPLVVVGAAFVETNGAIRALACHADDSAPWRASRLRRCPSWRGRTDQSAAGGLGAAL